MGKKWELKIREVDKDIFEAVRNGKKSVETRAATEKYRPIKMGDVLIFVCGKDKFEKFVRRARIFKTTKTMLREYKIKSIAPHLSSEKELEKMYYSFPGYREKIKKYGLMALEL